MNRLITVFLSSIFICSTLVAGASDSVASVADIIPRVTSFTIKDKVYELPEAVTFKVKRGNLSSVFQEYMYASSLHITPVVKGTAAITFAISSDMTGVSTEGYIMDITPKGITITAKTETGAFYAVQSLLQLTHDGEVRRLQCAEVKDTPRFSYRGMHFDVSRHFRSVDFLKKQIDAMAQLKMNNMHLHLTDGAGWRMPVDAYPRLTQFAAWRPQRTWQDWRNAGTFYCESDFPGASGGFYSKDELRELVDYASRRHIRVIPEIEMPGHSEEVLAAYPELSCSGQPYKNSDFCPGKEATFAFLEKVIDEVIDVFPSEYIHIGGDEASKDAWKTCPDCQRRMKEEGIVDVDGLQSYLIKRMEKYINSHGRQIIGWDEILQGGVAPGATVMSWRGTEGGKKAIASGHDVIMTPGTYCYLDYSQDAPFREPVSIGGYTPLKKVYGYEPVEADMESDKVSHLLGVQANLWSEYVTEDSHAEHMYYPRAYAIAEIGWSTPEKDYEDFHRRSLAFNDLMQQRGYAPFDLKSEYGERHESLVPVTHKGVGAAVSYALPYSEKYPGVGLSTLTDGKRGGWNNNDGRWQGTLTDVDCTVDLGQEKEINYVGAAYMHSEGAWIHLPEEVVFSTSVNGVDFTPVATVSCDIDPMYPKIITKEYGAPVDGVRARYVRMQATKNPRPGSWLFTDEFIIN
ncbi:MAG: family 20 glycosylhydrolase [Paramuribaculum sp.]|nr:family 20 glycosylhydrolase [Paramuribaculum sp.]